MSERTAQCQECTNVFPIAARGIAPKLCPDCKRGEQPAGKRLPPPTVTVRRTFARAPLTPRNGKPCPTAGCPGKLDETGSCACCVKRQAWLDAQYPKKDCEICGGQITAKFKYCRACTTLAKRHRWRESRRDREAKKKRPRAA